MLVVLQVNGCMLAFVGCVLCAACRCFSNHWCPGGYGSASLRLSFGFVSDGLTDVVCGCDAGVMLLIACVCVFLGGLSLCCGYVFFRCA